MSLFNLIFKPGHRGNLTYPDGRLLAHIVKGVGGDYGIIDSTGIFHIGIATSCHLIFYVAEPSISSDARYTVVFVADGKYGYVETKGFGPAVLNASTVLNKFVYAIAFLLST